MSCKANIARYQAFLLHNVNIPTKMFMLKAWAYLVCIVSYTYKLYHDTYLISKSRIITPILLSSLWEVWVAIPHRGNISYSLFNIINMAFGHVLVTPPSCCFYTWHSQDWFCCLLFHVYACCQFHLLPGVGPKLGYSFFAEYISTGTRHMWYVYAFRMTCKVIS